MMRFARNVSGISSVASIVSLLAAAGLATISLCYNGTLLARRRTAAGPLHSTSLFFTFRRSVLEMIHDGDLGQRDGSEVAAQSKTGKKLSKRLQYLNYMWSGRGQSIRSLRFVASREATGFAMRDDRR
jgi:hypothetical protein